MNRRQFLIVGGVSTVGLAAAAGAWRIGGVWWNQDSGDNWQVLSDHEATIAAAIADAMFPGDDRGMPTGTEAGAVETLDEYLGAIPEHTANLLRLLLHAIDEMAIPSGLGMTRFHLRSLDERIELLNNWDASMLGPRREAFEGLKLILAMGYCESPDVLEAAGIDYECVSMS